MSLTAGKQLLLSSPAGGYQVSRSLRFNASDSPYLSRTFSTTGTNLKIRTFSCWVKRSLLSGGGGYNSIISCFKSADATTIYFEEATSRLLINCQGNIIETSQVFRDVSAWYHLVVSYDTTQATPSNRVKLYVNGVQVTAFASATYPSLNADIQLAVDNANNVIGQYFNLGGYYINGYLADIHFIDGQALTPSDFAETDTTTGQWIPKAYTGSYGTNGFHLEFADNSNNTASTLGKDTSGNGNNWTPNNLSVTAGAGNDSLTDTPTSYGTDTGAGGEVRGNYCTWNLLDKGSSMSLANGNLDVSNASSWNTVRGTIGISSGKWYWEYTMITGGLTMVGIGTKAIGLGSYIGDYSSGYAYYSFNGTKWNAGSSTYGSSFTANDVISVAFDADAGKIWFAKNGTWQASGNPAAGTNAAFSSIPSDTYFPGVSQDYYEGTSSGALNAGQRAFAYTAPSGFKALCDTNLTAPVVAKPNTVMDVKLYTGNGSSQSISSVGFSPDFVWIKQRSGSATAHSLEDIVRGTNKHLASNSTDAEVDVSIYGGGVTAFNTAGFSLGSWGAVNENNQTYVSWLWDAGDVAASSNNSGSIISTVKVNATAGFSIVTWTGTGSGTYTVGHGLGVAPSFIITKFRSAASNWECYHASLGNAYTILLNSTGAALNRPNRWNSTSPTSTVFTIGTDINDAQTCVGYCFSPVTGYSSFGSYTGNGSTDGPFVYTGFRPRFILGKVSSTTDGWYIFDAARSPYNVTDKYFAANASAAEATFTFADFLSNGFKLRATTSDWNASGQTYIYAAFAENPFQYARAR